MAPKKKDLTWKLKETGANVKPFFESFYLYDQGEGRFQFCDERRLSQFPILLPGVVFSGDATWPEVLEIALREGVVLHLHPWWKKSYCYPNGTFRLLTVEERVQNNLNNLLEQLCEKNTKTLAGS